MDQTAKTKNLETGIEFIEHESSNNIPDHTCHVVVVRATGKGQSVAM